MIKDFFLVATGSFFGGGLRFLVSRWAQSAAVGGFPFGTLTVNLIGCLALGFLSGLPFDGRLLTPHAKLLLTTGVCGGFTTFSTFMNEGAALMKAGDYVSFSLYVAGSILLGLFFVVLGHQLARLA